MEDDLNALHALAHRVDVDSQIQIWRILKRYLESMYCDEPDTYTAKRVWPLNQEAPTFARDCTFILTHLPGHFVVPRRPCLHSRGTRSDEPSVQEDLEELHALCDKRDIASLKRVWYLLRRHCPSLLSLEPTRGVSPHVWTLSCEHHTFGIDSQFIKKHLPGHAVTAMRPYLCER